MDLNYINKKCIEEIFKNENNLNEIENNDSSNENKIYIFTLYEGYDIYLLIDYLLGEIKLRKILGNIYMINFSDYFIKLINNNYNNTIEVLTSKNKNEIGKIFSLTDRVFLKDLISKEIFISQISAVIISPTTYFDKNEKIWCIQNFLLEEGKKILFFYLLQNQKHFYFFYNSLNSNVNLTPNNHKIFALPRNNIIIDKIIKRKYELNKMSIIQVNINNNINDIYNANANDIPIIRDIRMLLEKLLNIIYEEVVKNLPSFTSIDKNKDKDNNLNILLSEYYKYRTINNDDCINNIHFNLRNLFVEQNPKLKSLYYDLLSIKFLLKKCDSYDLATLYNIFKEIKNFSENENSIFSYQDSTTENLIFDLSNKLKNNLYTIKYNDNRIITEEESVILDEFFELYIFINMDQEIKNELRKILETNLIELKADNDFFRINYNKYIQLINVLESKRITKNAYNINKDNDKKDNIENKKEEVLIITNNECIIDNFKSIFNIYGLNKKISNNKDFFNDKNYLDNNRNIYQEFFEYNFRRFLINKREFLTRYKIISSIKSVNNISNYYKENLLLHYLCYQLTRSFDIKHEGLFDRIYETYQKNNSEVDLLPSELAEEITEDIFNEYIQQNFNEDETFPLINIDYISLNCREYYKKEINLLEKLRNKNYSKIILFDYNKNIFRILESFIVNYSQTIDTVFIFLDYNSYNFKIDCKNSSIELIYFKHLTSNLKNNIININDNDSLLSNQNNIPIINDDNNNINSLQNDFIKLNSKKKEEEKYNIIVDYRELGSKTPYYLYKNNFNIINGSLEVGDYILTNNYCIERKSISTNDFYQSLNSKHLVEQMIKMGKYYKNIIILLEFEEHINILNTFEKGICYKPIILRKLLDLTNIAELEKNNCYFMWSLSCKMSSMMLKSLREKLNDEILDIDYCLNINKINKGKSSINKTKVDKNNIINDINKNNAYIINNKSQKIKMIDSFFNSNKKDLNDDENEKNKDEGEITMGIEKYEAQNYGQNYDNEIMNKKLDISIEKIIRNIPGINSNNYDLIGENFNNLYEFVTCEKEKKYEIFGRINSTKILSLFNYEY